MKLFKKLLIIISFSIIYGCGDEPAKTIKPDETKKEAPVIYNITPDYEEYGGIFKITGKYFGKTTKTTRLFINETECKIISINDSVITSSVPYNAKSGNVTINNNELVSNTFYFAVIQTARTVEHGDYIWTAYNLDVTHYRNGDVIPEVRDKAEWAKIKTGAWCYYNNDTVLGAYYGKLYNWYAVNDPRGLAPYGWRIPTYIEWSNFLLSLGGYEKTGGKLKAKNTVLWDYPNTGAGDSIGFSALGGGYRHDDGTFTALGKECKFWTSTFKSIEISAKYVLLSYISENAFIDDYRNQAGYSVRCIKNK